MEGQNDSNIDLLTLPRADFDAFVACHQPSVSSAGVIVVPEPVTSICGSYAVIDSQERFLILVRVIRATADRFLRLSSMKLSRKSRLTEPASMGAAEAMNSYPNGALRQPRTSAHWIQTTKFRKTV